MHDREWVRTGTSELVRGRVSVDMGMCIKKAREGKQAHVRGCAHVRECGEGVPVGESKGASSPWCQPLQEAQKWGLPLGPQ